MQKFNRLNLKFQKMLQVEPELSNPFTEVVKEKYTVDQIEEIEPSKDVIGKGRSNLFMFTTTGDLPFILMACSFMCLSSVGIPLQTIIYGMVFGKLSDFFKNKYPKLEIFMADVRLLCCLIMLIGFAKMVVTWAGIITWMKFGEKQATRARRKVLTLILSKRTSWFESKESLMGDVSQINRCIEELRCGTSEVIGLLVQTIASIIALFITAMVQSWSLTLVIMASAPLMGLLGWFFGRLTYNAAELENDLTARASKILDWTLVCGAEVRIFNGKYYEMVKFNKMVDLSAKAYYKLANAIAGNAGMLKCLTLLMFVQGLWFGNYMISTGKLSINQVFTCFSSCLLLGSEVSEISVLLATLNKGQAASSRIAKMIGNDNTSSNSGIYLNCCKGFIELDNVNFKYKSRPGKVLNNMCIALKPNELNFIIGPSGSGKSTVFQLLQNDYQLQSGSIRIDGHNISTLSTKWLTDNITLVQQDPIIFNESIRNNIALAAIHKFASLSDVPDRAIEEAAEFSLLDDVINDSTRGLNANVSESSLSGGQLQRIAIARAKIIDPPILILDEALSALDYSKKRCLFERIKKWRKGRTTIIITHEFDQINQEDYVFLIENGSVKTKGHMRDLSHEGMILQDKAIDFEKSYYKSSYSSVSHPSSGANDPFVCHYLNNPAILKNLENYPKYKVLLDERPDELLSALSILNYCKNTISNKTLIAVGVALTILGGASGPIFSFCFSKLLMTMVDASIEKNIEHGLLKWSCVIVGISIGSGIIHYLSLFILSYCSEKWIVNLRKLAFKKLNEQELSYFHSAMKEPAELTALLMNDSRDLRSLISEFVSIIINLVAMLLVGIIWSLVTGWKLALVGIVFVPLILIITEAYSIVLKISENGYKSKVAILENYNHEIIKSIKLIKSLNLKSYFTNEFELKLEDVNKIGTLRAICTGFGISLSDLCTSIATGTILYYGIALVGKREYTQSQLLLVITILSFSMANAASLLTEIPDIARGQRAGTYILGLLKLKPSEIENDGNIKPFKKDEVETVRFQNVTFQYPNCRNGMLPILNNISFCITRNEIVAITGASGSGKSTIGSLLSRLYKVPDRSIFISNYDINSVDIDWLRDTISVVPQIPRFFEGTIYDNLVYGMEKAKIIQVRIDHCLKLANIYSFIVSLPEGINTRLGEGSYSLLSGGQLQRLSIARALVRNPKILIMDECTSNLDPQNTNIIIELIKNNLAYQNMTIIIITHNLELMKITDKVICIKDGKISVQNDANRVR